MHPSPRPHGQGGGALLSLPMHDFKALENRLRKTLAPRKKWAAKVQTDAFRLYEQDIPELKYIVDLYGDHAVVYDRRSDRTLGEVDNEHELHHDQALLLAVTRALALPAEHVHIKRRRRISTRDDQYTRLGTESVSLVVHEASSRYKVNLSDYLDTGLFLDHRPLRQTFRNLHAQTALQDPKTPLRFLNLFCYTGSVSVAAAQGGAQTVSVDLSGTYLDWARENFRLSGIAAAQHDFIRADAREFVSQGPGKSELFDIIFLDPPSFSNSKKMAGTFDIQRDHRKLIEETMVFLKPGGTLWFSTNLSKFSLDSQLGKKAVVDDVTAETVPEDFRNKTIHRCFRITPRR